MLSISRGVLAAALWAGLMAGNGAFAAPRVDHDADDARCTALRGLALPAARLGLPTRGVQVVSAEPVRTAPAHCKVAGAIRPIDTQAPDIRFELALPVAWNGKALMIGGGGFNGVIPDVSGDIMRQPAPDVASPLSRGYATFGSDSGHQQTPGGGQDGAFLANDEALANYGGDALKKTRDAAAALIERRYGAPPRRTYFAGASNGGREAFRVIQRWPQDFDGAIVAYPMWDFTGTAMQFGAVARRVVAPGATTPPATRQWLFDAIMGRCDPLDGLADGLISNVAACRVPLETFACATPGQRAEPCLTGPQMAWLRAYDAPAALPYLGRGAGYPGHPVLQGMRIGAEDAGDDPALYARRRMGFAHWYGEYLRHAIVRDPSFDALAVDPVDPGPLAPRIRAVAALLDAGETDLSAFARRGGKLILWHGLADPKVSHRATEAYHAGLTARMGGDRVRRFARFYLVPGFGHGDGDFIPVWDPLTALEAWSERGRAPDTPVARDRAAGHAGRARPLCEIGTWPRYVGGDARSATSFRCTPDAGP
ncbi:tannase/feruloyl esterase family alpha/beta hydrolase [Phenylobacterium sp.]|uniref:tannase/feruloyl esterase family alpha/beta hydrolase n=1 Tax=Phenylobacterium sp. TaxID=1871053 RepID=UPI00301D3D95